jgi:hypothetical protein
MTMVDENKADGSGKAHEAGNLARDTEPKKETVNDAAGAAQDTLGSIKATACEWSGTVADTTKERPLTALLAAVSAGYLLHMLIRGRRS